MSIHGKSGDAALRGDQQGLAERTGVEAVDHLQSFAAALVVTWRHGLMGDEEVVQSAAARQTHLQGGIEHAGRAFEQAARVIDGDGLHEFLGAEATPAPEELLAVRRAEPQVLGQPLEGGLLRPRCGQEGDGPADQRIVARAIRGERGGGFGDGGCVQHGSSSRLLAAVTPDLVGVAAQFDPFLAGALFL